MKEPKVSRSAGIIAAHRAAEASKKPEKRICYDPFARRFLPPGFTVIGEVDMDEEATLNLFKDIVPGFHEFFLARTRYIDDFLKKCIQQELEQLVILGAGYDSRAYRINGIKDRVDIFEVDHPATQKAKTEKLLQIFNEIPPQVTLVPIDFQTGNLKTSLFENGYDNTRKTLFIMEGVTMYIDQETVDKTFSFIATNSGTGSLVIFDYTFPEVIDGTYDIAEAKGWLKIADKSDEPLLFGLRNEQVERFLTERGFFDISVVTNEYFNKNYFPGPDEKRKTTPILSIAHAEVII